MKRFVSSFFTVSTYTAISRLLGFVRDIFIARYLGSTIVADAFFVAFRIPNFFRRVLAEGAYSAAIIPVFSGIIMENKNEKEASDFVENTMSFLLCITIMLTVFFYFGMPYIIQVLAPGFSKNKEAFDLAVHFGKIIFPYLIFISLVAHFTSTRAARRRVGFRRRSTTCVRYRPQFTSMCREASTCWCPSSRRMPSFATTCFTILTRCFSLAPRCLSRPGSDSKRYRSPPVACGFPSSPHSAPPRPDQREPT